MKIAFVIDRELPGPGRTALVEYATAVGRLGNEVVVLCPRADRSMPFPVLTPDGGATPGRWRFLLWAATTLRRVDADVQHLFFSRGMALVARAAGVRRTIVDVRSVSLGAGARGRLSRLLTRLELGLVPGNIATIDPGIDPMLFGPLPLTPIGRTPIGTRSNADRRTAPASWARPVVDEPDVVDVAMVGSLFPVRDLGRLLDGFGRAEPRRNGLRLWLIGDGPLRSELEATAARMGLGDRIRFTGQVSHEDVIASLPYFDVGLAYVPITDYFDHQPPLKTVEYLAAGLPVVATATTSHRRTLAGVDRHLLTGDGPDELADALVGMANRLPDHGDWRDDAAYLRNVRTWDDIAGTELSGLYQLVGASHA